ncbi:MAG: hypothetical protein U9P14_11990 [Gemmatimonadota bacterium]|nr:hypothetical protein [Gemmatimonadota bacterium]
MMRKKLIFIILAVVTLTGLLAGPVMAEMLGERISRGNNLGIRFHRGWGGPFGTILFPAGSNNQITNSSWGFGQGTVRDLNGDGLPSDTLVQGDGGSATSGIRSSLEAYNKIMAYVAAGEPNIGSAMGRLENSRVWSSLDGDDLIDWPAEGRIGRSMDGKPVLHGRESLFFHLGNAFVTYSDFPAGIYMGWQVFLLDYGESNNMAYFHVHIANASEYLQYNQNSDFKAIGKLFPEGQTWLGFMCGFYNRSIRFGGVRAGWAYHPAKNIIGYYPTSPTSAEFTPPEPPIMGWKMLKKPQLRGQVAEVACAHGDPRNPEFGVSNIPGGICGYLRHQEKYMAMQGRLDMISGMTNPFTGKPGIFSYPGKMTEEDTRYNQWLWGGAFNYGFSEYYGELQDVAPRDTMSLDFVLMVAPSGVTPLVHPEYDLANMDDPVMQEALAPLEDYASAAEEVFVGGLVSPETPIPPKLTIIPGDRSVTITWSDVNIDTPDAFYALLQEKGWDPNGYYREYDFEGYRVYRSFVGPNDSHSELLADFNLTDDNIQYHYIDKLDDDIPYRRMTNGAKVWYAVVPYDKNLRVTDGEEFSLPDPVSSKPWNWTGTSSDALYQAIPRSEASNFRAAKVEGAVVYTPAYGNPVFASSAALSGDGSGKLTEAPKYLAPVATLNYEAVNNERLKSAQTIVVETRESKEIGHSYSNTYGNRKFQLTESDFTGAPSRDYQTYVRSNRAADVLLNGPITDDGASYAVSCRFEYMSNGNFRSRMYKNLDLGSYTASTTTLFSAHSAVPQGLFCPTLAGYYRPGRFTVTWVSGGEGLSLEVKDVVRDYVLPFVEYPDEGYGWGFVFPDNFDSDVWPDLAPTYNRGHLHNDARYKVPVAERTVKMYSSLPADNTTEFGIWFNGMMWGIQGPDDAITAMPAAGTVFTLDVCMGTWNGDKTVFTQVPSPPWPGDKWTIKVKPSTLDPEDADLSKIKVVPNPYLGGSFLDFSPTNRRIEFINLPAQCTVRIYSLGGNLVNVLNHIGSNRQGWGNYTDLDRLSLGVPQEYSGYDNHTGTEPWNLRNRFGQTIASGLYFYHVTDSRGKTHTGKFYIVN